MAQTLRQDTHTRVQTSHTAAHCSTLQHTAAHCNTKLMPASIRHGADTATKHRQNTFCNTLQRAMTQTLRQDTHTHAQTSHTAAHCNTLQHTTAHCNTKLMPAPTRHDADAATKYRRNTFCNTLQHAMKLTMKRDTHTHTHAHTCKTLRRYTAKRHPPHAHIHTTLR